MWWTVHCTGQPMMTSSVLDQEATKHFPKPDVHQKQAMVTVLWSAAGLIHYSFLNPGKTIVSEKYAQQIDRMHWKLQCWQLALVNRKGPILLHDNAQLYLAQPMLLKLNKLGCKVLPQPPYLLSSHQLSLLQASRQLFVGKILPQLTRCRKCLPTVHWIPKHGFLCCRNKQIYFSLAKIC